MIILATRFLELFVGVLSILSFRRNTNNKYTVNARDLLHLLEERDRTIERLQIRLHALEMRLAKQDLHNS